MKKLIFLNLLFSFSILGFAQYPVNQATEIQNDTVVEKKDVKKEKQKPQFNGNRVFYGGSLGFSFGSVTSVRVNPLIGYRLTPKLSAGITALYEYNGYDTYYGKQNYNNYGGSVFGRFRFIPQIYAHAEFNYTNYQMSNALNEKYRVGVPFILLGGGFTQRIGGNAYAYGQILFDVLQDKNSPYDDWVPFYSVGVSVGF